MNGLLGNLELDVEVSQVVACVILEGETCMLAYDPYDPFTFLGPLEDAPLGFRV